MSTNYKVLHKRSGVEGKKPTSADIALGEIAINFAKDKEFLSILNGNNEIATFSSDKYLDVIIPPIICENISGCTDQIINERTSASTNPVATRAVYDYTYSKDTIDEKIASGGTFDPTRYYTKDEIDERDFVVSSALNDLETDKADKAEVNTAIADYTYDKATIDRKVASGGTFDPTQYYNKADTDALLNAKVSTSAVTQAVDATSTDPVSSKAVYNYTYSKSQVYTKNEIDEDERVISQAVNELESNLSTNYATRIETNDTLSAYTYDKATIDQKVASGGTFDPTQYYNKTDIDNRLGTGITPSSSVTTAVNSINQNLSSNYYTKSEINQKELVVSASLNNLEENKASVSDINSAVSSYTYDKATIDEKDAELSDDLNVLTDYRDFHIGYNSVSTLNRVPTTKRLVLASGITQGNNTLSLSDSFKNGYEMYFIIQGTSGTEINLSPNMINTSGESIIINNNGYCEISVISIYINGNYTYYVRGI